MSEVKKRRRKEGLTSKRKKKLDKVSFSEFFVACRPTDFFSFFGLSVAAAANPQRGGRVTKLIGR